MEEKKPPCPVCKSTTTGEFQDNLKNGVLGPGYRVSVRHQYHICLDCGVLFKSKEQIENYKKKLL